jgi:hypothetical protein
MLFNENLGLFLLHIYFGLLIQTPSMGHICLWHIALMIFLLLSWIIVKFYKVAILP